MRALSPIQSRDLPGKISELQGILGTAAKSSSTSFISLQELFKRLFSLLVSPSMLTNLWKIFQRCFVGSSSRGCCSAWNRTPPPAALLLLLLVFADGENSAQLSQHLELNDSQGKGAWRREEGHSNLAFSMDKLKDLQSGSFSLLHCVAWYTYPHPQLTIHYPSSMFLIVEIKPFCTCQLTMLWGITASQLLGGLEEITHILSTPNKWLHNNN